MLAGRPSSNPVALCLGVFDGVHRGHIAIINAARRFISGVSGGRVLALTFDPHPTRIIHPESPQALLQSLPARVVALEQAGCDQVIVLPFNRELSKRSPEEFWTILQHLVPGRILGIFAGQNWRFGAGRNGTLAQLSRLANSTASTVIGVPPVLNRGQVISSTWIRNLVTSADFASIPPMLGRPFELSGMVVTGQKMARTWGFPTANLYPAEECLPPNGVYSGWTRLPERPPVWTICNLGVRPSLGGDQSNRILEAHLFDFDEDLYGRSIRFEPVYQIREEQKFPSIESLKRQISEDVALAKTQGSQFGMCRDGDCSPIS